MRDLGFKEYLPSDKQGYIITSFLYPDDENFGFDRFYNMLIEKGYVEKRPLTDEEKNKWDHGSFYYTWKKDMDFKLSEEGESFYRNNIFPVLEWCVGLWRSMYNIRELDVVIPDSYKWKSFLEKTVAKAATQGFMTCYWVIKNIRKYYEMIIAGKEKKE